MVRSTDTPADCLTVNIPKNIPKLAIGKDKHLGFKLERQLV